MRKKIKHESSLIIHMLRQTLLKTATYENMLIYYKFMLKTMPHLIFRYPMQG